MDEYKIPFVPKLGLESIETMHQDAKKKILITRSELIMKVPKLSFSSMQPVLKAKDEFMHDC